MKIHKALYFFSLACLSATAQKPQQLKFKKDASLIYFFQKGAAADTVSKERSDLFYFLVPDPQKKDISVLVNNGRIVPTANDSLVRLEHLPGLSYESVFEKRGDTLGFVSGRQMKAGVPSMHLLALINGATEDKETQTILVRIINRKEEKTILENVFFYKD